MGWQDRPYYRDQGPGSRNPLMWLLGGSVPLFTVFGIRVRAHASLIIVLVLSLIFGMAKGNVPWEQKITSAVVLFIVVLLHEFGHCFAARWVGGSAEDILMHPLGGLAMTRPPRRPLPTFITVAGGPFVNVLLCAICGLIQYVGHEPINWNPFILYVDTTTRGFQDLFMYSHWVFQISWMLLVFNVCLPFFPFDGGQMVQTMLWPKFGYYKSMLFATTFGVIGAIGLAAFGIATGGLWLVVLAFMGGLYSYQIRQQLLAAGPYGFSDEPDYSSSLYDSSEHAIRKKLNKRSIKRAQKRERDDRIEQRKIDSILAKVSAQGMQSLTWWERRTLRKATERQREAEMPGRRGH